MAGYVVPPTVTSEEMRNSTGESATLSENIRALATFMDGTSSSPTSIPPEMYLFSVKCYIRHLRKISVPPRHATNKKIFGLPAKWGQLFA